MRFGQHWLEEVAERLQLAMRAGPHHKRWFLDGIERELRWKFREEWEDELRARRVDELAAAWEWIRKSIPARRAGLLEGRVELGSAGDSDVFTCYASAFNVETANGLVFLPGAFKSAIPGFLESGLLMVDHRIDLPPIGDPIDAREDGEGLIVTGRFRQDATAQECRDEIRRKLAAGEPAACSITYTFTGCREEDRDGRPVRVISEVERLYELSVCGEGANPGARFLSA